MQCCAAFENRPSFGVTSLNRESNDLSVRGSSNCLNHCRCSESLQGTVQLSNFPPSNEQLPSNNLQESIPWRNSSPSNSLIALSSMESSAFLGDSRADMLCEAGLNNSYSHVDSRVSASGSMMDQSNAVSSNTNDVSLFSQLNGEAPFPVQHPEGEKSSFDTDLMSNDNFLFLHSKPQNGFSRNNFESLEDIMSSVLKTSMTRELPLSLLFTFFMLSFSSF